MYCCTREMNAAHDAAQRGDLTSLHRALSSGDAEEIISRGPAAVIAAAAQGHTSCIAALLDAGASGAVSTPSGETALHLVARNNHALCARVLLEGGTLVNARSMLGCTPLHSAAWDGRVATARVLLEYGADLTACCVLGKTPVRLADDYGHTELATMLRNPPTHCFATSPAAAFTWRREVQMLTFMLGILPVQGPRAFNSALPDDICRSIAAHLQVTTIRRMPRRWTK